MRFNLFPRCFCNCLLAFYAASAFISARAAEASPGPVTRLIASGQTNAALSELNTLLQRAPADPALRFLKAVVLTDLQRNAEAQAVYEALTLDYPDLAEPYNNLAGLYAAQGDYERARIALEQALRANPEYAAARVNLGDVHVQLAQQSYQKALRLEPRDASVPAKLLALRRLTDTASLPTRALP